MDLMCDKPRLMWLKPNVSLVNNFIANSSLILKIFLSTGLIDLNIALQKKKKIITRATNVWTKFTPFINDM